MATDKTLTGTATPGRNPQEEKAKVRAALGKSAFRRLPVRRYEIGGKGKQRIITLFTVKPTAFPEDVKASLRAALSEALGKEVSVFITNEAVATAKNIRRTPMKVRHVLQLVRGQRVDKAFAILQFTPNFAADDILNVLKSAAANANNGWGADADELVVRECYADHGPRMKRFRPGPMGRARPILKLLSHITVVVGDAE